MPFKTLVVEFLSALHLCWDRFASLVLGLIRRSQRFSWRVARGLRLNQPQRLSFTLSFHYRYDPLEDCPTLTTSRTVALSFISFTHTCISRRTQCEHGVASEKEFSTG
eukprot:1653463-Pleurochrysis_carterae.AAC.2